MKLFIKTTALTLVILFVLFSCCAAERPHTAVDFVRDFIEEHTTKLLTVNEALLSAPYSQIGKIEIRNDFDEYNPDNLDEVYPDGLRMIIIQREAPEKEFTKLNSGYPNNYKEGFPEDFLGVDIGKTKVWLRYDLMSKLPVEYRASSLENADILVIAETYYEFSGSISVTQFTDTDDNNTSKPICNTIEDLENYLSKHPRRIDAIYFYPKFSAINVASIFNRKAKNCLGYDISINKPQRFARNPDADDQWYDMEMLSTLMDLIKPDACDEASVLTEIDNLSFISSEKKDLWKMCISSKEYETAKYSMMQQYWLMVYRLANLDTDENNKKCYQSILDKPFSERKQSELADLVSYADYSGFDTPIETIEKNKQYMAKPDYEWIEKTLNDFILSVKE